MEILHGVVFGREDFVVDGVPAGLGADESFFVHNDVRASKVAVGKEPARGYLLGLLSLATPLYYVSDAKSGTPVTTTYGSVCASGLWQPFSISVGGVAGVCLRDERLGACTWFMAFYYRAA